MKNFTFAMKWHEILKPYSDDIRREVYDAVIEYAGSGQIIEMQPLARMAFDFIRYEIDDKARRREARLAKKQQKESQKSDNPLPSTPSAAKTMPHNESQADPKKIAEEYLATGKAPEPFTVNHGNIQVTMSKKRIRSFVIRCAQDIIDKKRALGHSELLTKLDHLVACRYEMIYQDVVEQCTTKPFSEELWEAVINYASYLVPA